MAQAWMVMGETYLLTIVVSLFVPVRSGGEAAAGFGRTGRGFGVAGRSG